MSDQQEWRVHFYHQVDIVPISPCQQLRPSSVPASDSGSLCSDSRDLLERMQNVEVPTPPVSLVHVLAKPPAKVPEPDLFKRMKNVEVPTPPMSLVCALAKPLSKVPKANLFRRMKNAEVPTPPMSWVHALAKPPSKAPEPNLFERMRNAEVPTPPTALPESWRATIPQAPSPTEAASLEMSPRMPTVEVPQESSLDTEVHVDQGNAPDHSNRVNFGDPDQRWLGTLFSYALVGNLPTIEEHQLLQCAELAAADTNDDGRPAMKQLAVNILCLVTSQVKSLQVGQYTMDMLDLLEVLWYPHVGYDVEPYAGGLPYPTQQSTIEMEIIYLGCCIECATTHLLGMPQVCDWPKEWFYNLHLDLCQEDQRRFQDELQQIPLTTFQMIDQIGHFIPNWIPRSANKNVGLAQYVTEFQELRGSKIFCIAYDYFQHAWPFEQPSMGECIDEWIDGQVHTYIHSLREIKGEVEQNDRDIDHLFSWWSALS
ncbi:hypothetical protein EDC04DRAFT_2611553 [Pisolithus marmoratus]|nr:hypothetical protein EDC04DRAFT_2611553 [Pisolithus marmoratus]